MKHKMIFVTGGVVSSIGKGITTAALGRLLTNRGYRVHALKIDPYINVDAGTMNPFQHGEVFVTNDGAETDLDLGNYERFLGTELSGLSNFTSGAVYRSVIEKEREGKFLGETVQLIPHITNEIKDRIYRLARESRADVLICEVGGTIGDFETPPFVEAMRQVRMEMGIPNTLLMHVTLVVSVAWGEVKTKPTQHSVRELLSLGVQPDMLICRTKQPLSRSIREKISQSCGVPLNAVIEACDVDCIEEIPLILEEQGVGELVVERLSLPATHIASEDWARMVHRLKNPEGHARIAVVGKYTTHGDAYLSVQEALKHGGIANDAQVEIKWVDSESLTGESDLDAAFADVSGILVPGGYGIRGIEGMIVAARHARERRIPYLGLCLGMQCMVIEFARNVAGLERANSREFDEETPHPVVDLMETQVRRTEKGGTQRLGIYPCVLSDENTIAYQGYRQPIIVERHRHRYEVNNTYRQRLQAHGIVWSGLSPGEDLVEIAELADHPHMLGCQFHPEFRSKPLEPHPLFVGFVRAALGYVPAKEG
ncbi:CTP synthase [Candidatus Poribacteria bacterium]|nr:CTP synthase [Candidatus Poribacteria bacterium]